MKAAATFRILWEQIDTVLLDMDGVLLDLRFDNYFWNELVPYRYGECHGLEATEAYKRLRPIFQAKQGTLEWYCLDYWGCELGLDLHALKREASEGIRFLPRALDSLRQITRMGKRLVLVTNAHRETLAIKSDRTQLTKHFDAVYTAHDFGRPKEDTEFWRQFAASESLVPHRALLVDDSLPVLRAAAAFGIRYLVAAAQPDTGAPAREISEFPAVRRLSELFAYEAETPSD